MPKRSKRAAACLTARTTRSPTSIDRGAPIHAGLLPASILNQPAPASRKRPFACAVFAPDRATNADCGSGPALEAASARDQAS